MWIKLFFLKLITLDPMKKMFLCIGQRKKHSMRFNINFEWDYEWCLILKSRSRDVCSLLLIVEKWDPAVKQHVQEIVILRSRGMDTMTSEHPSQLCWNSKNWHLVSYCMPRIKYLYICFHLMICCFIFNFIIWFEKSIMILFINFWIPRTTRFLS